MASPRSTPIDLLPDLGVAGGERAVFQSRSLLPVFPIVPASRSPKRLTLFYVHNVFQLRQESVSTNERVQGVRHDVGPVRLGLHQ